MNNLERKPCVFSDFVSKNKQFSIRVTFCELKVWCWVENSESRKGIDRSKAYRLQTLV